VVKTTNQTLLAPASWAGFRASTPLYNSFSGCVCWEEGEGVEVEV